ncbi:MAG: NUDIX domain-containing protein [Bacteroidetes bacterium]|nr:NUDIX domain-containing protein [Bacteroidota bacterium]
MNLFVNDIPVAILKQGSRPAKGEINAVLDATVDKITKAALINHVWIKNASIADLGLVLDLINSKVPLQLLSLSISVANRKEIKAYLRKKFNVVDAAGGLVLKKDRILMIYRLKRWDLPKGKRDPGESFRATAEREVNEECNIKVEVGQRLVTTWHTYTMNKNNMLKRTRWYLMELTDDSKMRPEEKEDIEDLRWMNQKEVYHALENSYNSIRFVFSSYYALEKTDA